ncbi:uncharacterized protein LOC126486072 [Schistocerca serialis cubense]|uniref:uncharacterized protein LOC126486072 n=1 Tax=Schistocerca serialis cubense TaxID=2023355 RepID=UPI00214EFDD8|nr:uncharacterized protein LOC126486072 [Schistocerca serialis cubense]XP_049964880.1 uncharacterized protein LOC126486072 [Schistocerca serialis cubense]
MGDIALSFCKQMRAATRDVHAVSDALVNAKLAFALSDNTVWADGLLVFYEVFRFLEGAMDRHSVLAQLEVPGLRRREAFERDLARYLGEGWCGPNYQPRASVATYIHHLEKLEKEDPVLLSAYIYHLYMGLLSGGQILRRKRAFREKLLPAGWWHDADSDSVTDFHPQKPSALKKMLATAMEEFANGLTADMREKLIVESKNVFRMNNLIIRSVKGTTQVFLKKCVYAATFLFLIVLLYLYLFPRQGLQLK